jgi:hydroxymethylglutaryl-CoA lyase
MNQATLNNSQSTGQKVKLVECPRDAMQGWEYFIPTSDKIKYLNLLLRVGFDTLDFGSFVSPKAIPQMADTKEVIGQLDLFGSKTKLLAIVANTRGAEEACVYDMITYLGFPFSVSETFQHRNTNSPIATSLQTVESIYNLCIKNNKVSVVYMSMGFGNPYGDPYSEEIVLEWIDKLVGIGIQIISLADTVGLATAEQVKSLTAKTISTFPSIETGVHLHAQPGTWKEKVEAALQSGCYRFDGALKGIGGCPMANDELVGNLDTELMISYFESLQLLGPINKDALYEAGQLSNYIFSKYA